MWGLKRQGPQQVQEVTAEDAEDEVDEAGGKSMVLCHQMLATTQIEVGVLTL